ncbi:hypothetical protein ARMSODRAFT_616329 [Armillaria solidipes]|uniref:GOLD domain-containing protein n=1 Tax=Armillaria solidipes TaxID=1076256 RepID=A0A2H3AT34_9AGAR|nr:hypothetical protein ARMSODRAFT_616329 [Armillaria solidipes]
MPLPPNDYVTMFSILLAFLYLTVSTRAFEISVPYFVVLNEPATATWTRSERDQGDFVFVLRSLQSGESERLSDIPNNLSSGTISLNFTRPGLYNVEIGRFNTEFIAIRISNPVLVLEVDGILNIPSKTETPNPKPSASSPPPDTALSSTTSNPATPHHASSFSAFPTSDSSLSSSTPASSSSTPNFTDTHSLSSSAWPTSGYGTIPSSSTSTSSPSAASSTASQSTSFSSSSASGTVSISSSITVTSSSSPTTLADSQSTSISPSSATGSVSVSSTATSSSPASTSIFTDSQSVPNSSSATSSPLPSITISSPLNSNATDSDGLPTTSFAGLSSISQQFLPVTSTFTIDTTAASTSIATSRTDDFTSGTSSSAPSSQVADSSSSTTISSDPSQGVTSESSSSHSFSFEPSPNGATGHTAHTTIPSSASVLQPTSTSYHSDSMEETRLPQVLGGIFAALSILLVILGLVLYRRHRRLKARTHDIEARENFNRRSGGLLIRPTMTRTQSPQSFSSAYISSTDEIVRLLDPSGHSTGPDYASATTHESHESNALTRRESSDIASEHSYHSLTSNPFLDPPEGPPPPELPRPNAVKRKSPVVQRPIRSGTQRSNDTIDSGTSRKTSRPESYFFMFVDGVMQPLDERSDRYRSLVLSSESSFLMPDQIVLQERADALHEEIVWLRRKVSSLPSDEKENEELLATIRMREEDLIRLDREIEGEEKRRRSDDPTHFSMDDMVMDYSRISR